MAISYATLRAAAAMPTIVVAKSISEARALNLKTVFLCHSHADQELAKGFVRFARSKGWEAYIDWLDTSLPSVPNRTTAAVIKERIRAANYLVFLATHNSTKSRWCPWEIGYADGVKDVDKILIVETRDDAGSNFGNEYLGLYRKLDIANDGKLAAWAPGVKGGVYATQL